MATTKRTKLPVCKAGARPKDNRRQATIVRFWPEMMAEVDAEARRLGVSRSAWISMAVRAKLDGKN